MRNDSKQESPSGGHVRVGVSIKEAGEVELVHMCKYTIIREIGNDWWAKLAYFSACFSQRLSYLKLLSYRKNGYCRL
jgi:hypothetical protein